VPVFAWQGETTFEEYWWCTERALDFGNGVGPTQIVELTGGDATLTAFNEGVKYGKQGGAVPSSDTTRQRKSS